MSIFNFNMADMCPILGLPKHGKTVFFVTACNELSKAIAKQDKMNFEYSSLNGGNTTGFVYSSLSKLNNQEWPDKTTESPGYACVLTTSHLLGLVSLTRTINYFDYAGEAYDYAFGIGQGRNINSMFKEQADQLMKVVSLAPCVFVVIDAEKMYNRDEDDLVMMSNLIELIRGRRLTAEQASILKQNSAFPRFSQVKTGIKFACKIGIIINKLELVPQDGRILDKGSSLSGQAIKLERVFAERYSNAYAWLRQGEYRFFPVWTVGKIEKNNEGGAIPAKPRSPRGLLAPFEWMLGIDLSRS